MFSSLLSTSINIENIIQIITSLIDIIAVTVIAITLIQTIIYLLKYNLKSLSTTSFQLSTTNSKIVKRSLVFGLLLTLEFEVANSILKMGVFLSMAIDNSISVSTATATAVTSESFINNFLIFVMILAVRIAINQSLQRFGGSKIKR